MEIYRLSPIGYKLSHSISHDDSPSKKAKWDVIYYLAKQHSATKEKILNDVSGATSGTLLSLKAHNIIINETEVGM
jgi:hypothetical protein